MRTGTRRRERGPALAQASRRAFTAALAYAAPALLVTGLLSAGSVGAVTTSPAYTQALIPTSFAPTGGLVVVGGDVLVGKGGFAGAGVSVVRIDAGGETVIADGFNSLSGFVYDAANDRLIVGDNGLEASGSETGDTLYSIPNPFGFSGTPLRASTLELLASGSISSTTDLAFDPADPTGNRLFVANSSSPAGEVLAVDLSLPSVSVLQSGIGFTGGVAATATSLILGELVFNPGSEGSIYSAALPGGTGARALLVGALPGQNDLVIAPDGTLLASNSEFGGPSTLDRFDPATGGLLETVASGFDFATGIAAEDDIVYAIEGGFNPTSGIFRFAPVPEPATGVLVLGGLVALAGARRRGRS